jgi:hypothetical protein
MAEFVSFDNKFLMLYNALPSCTLEELHKKARVALRRAKHAKHEVFALDVHWGGGEEHTTHTVLPGKGIRLAERHAKEIIQDFRPQGGLCAREPGLAAFKDDNDRHAAILEALMIAEEHYHICGAIQMEHVRSQRGDDDPKVERLRNSVYGSYLLAMAKEELIRDHRLSLESKGQQKKAS